MWIKKNNVDNFYLTDRLGKKPKSYPFYPQSYTQSYLEKIKNYTKYFSFIFQYIIFLNQNDKDLYFKKIKKLSTMSTPLLKQFIFIYMIGKKTGDKIHTV